LLRLLSLNLGLFDHLVKHVGLDIKDVRELNSLVQLLVNKRVHVEDDPLQVKDEHVRQLMEHGLALDCYSLLAGIALEASIMINLLLHYLKAIDGDLEHVGGERERLGDALDPDHKREVQVVC